MSVNSVPKAAAASIVSAVQQKSEGSSKRDVEQLANIWVKKLVITSLTPEPSAIGKVSSAPTQGRLGPSRIKVVTNVHEDDIHCIVKLADQTFVTGSKDGSLKKWNLDGTLNRTIASTETINYKYWVTALAVLNDRQWVSGTRDGNIDLWDTAGEYLQAFQEWHGPHSNDPKCKQRNQHRVNCLASFESYANKPLFFAGWATQFTLHSADTLKRLKYTYTSLNDWVYAVQPLSLMSLLIVTGCRLDIYSRTQDSTNWNKTAALVEEPQPSREGGRGERPKRPFISAVTPIEGNPAQYGLAVFDGSVRVMDVEQCMPTFQATEHVERVWTVENIAPNCIASCGDDGLIKLWDLRQSPNSIHTLLDNPKEKSRVSVLLCSRETELISGSCPDNAWKSKTKAQFSFWDMRRL